MALLYMVQPAEAHGQALRVEAGGSRHRAVTLTPTEHGGGYVNELCAVPKRRNTRRRGF